MQPLVYVVILNWNGWRDTLECLESVCRMSYQRFRVIVCDNDSNDESIAHFLDWTRGREEASAEDPCMAGYSTPPIPKPISAQFHYANELHRIETLSDCFLTIIQNGANVGFAAGCNSGIRYALAQGCEYVWLLNNDTVVAIDSLAALIHEAVKDPTQGGVPGSFCTS